MFTCVYASTCTKQQTTRNECSLEDPGISFTHCEQRVLTTQKTYSQHHANMLPLPRCCACFLTCVRIKALSYLDSKRIPQSLGVLSGQTDSAGTKESGPLDSRYSLNEFQGRVNPKMAKSKASRIDLIFKLEWKLDSNMNVDECRIYCICMDARYISCL